MPRPPQVLTLVQTARKDQVRQMPCRTKTSKSLSGCSYWNQGCCRRQHRRRCAASLARACPTSPRRVRSASCCLSLTARTTLLSQVLTTTTTSTADIVAMTASAGLDDLLGKPDDKSIYKWPLDIIQIYKDRLVGLKYKQRLAFVCFLFNNGVSSTIIKSLPSEGHVVLNNLDAHKHWNSIITACENNKTFRSYHWAFDVISGNETYLDGRIKRYSNTHDLEQCAFKSKKVKVWGTGEF